MEYECLREEKFGLLWSHALNQREHLIAEFPGIFQSFHRILLYGTFAYFQFPVISNKEKFVLALVINIIFNNYSTRARWISNDR